MLVTVAVRDYPGGGFAHHAPARLSTRDDLDAVIRDAELRALTMR